MMVMTTRSEPNQPAAQGGGSDAATAPVVLDPEALQRLRELDPTGASKLMERVVNAFDTSVSRLLPQLETARAAGDAVGIRHVAHTLKSSSSSIGAVKLSQMCAEMEALARSGQIEGMDDRIVALSAEIVAALDALKRALGHRA